METIVKQNLFVISPDQERNASFDCIDGRPIGNLPDVDTVFYRIPGNTLGLIGDVLGAETLAQEINPNFSLSLLYEKLVKYVDHKYGLSYHISDHVKNGGCGCGYVDNSIHSTERLEKYLLSAKQADYLEDLLKVLQRRGSKPLSHNGSHDEEAVVFINSKSIGIKPPIKGGFSAYVFHASKQEEMLEDISRNIYPMDTLVSQEKWLELLKRSASKRLQAAVKDLGAYLLPTVIVDLVDGEAEIVEIIPSQKLAA
jgi:hypothetical protein